MGLIKIMSLGWLAVATLALSAFAGKTHTIKNNTDTGKGFAVIELFTSEGCSSCPPADAVVAKIEKESTDKPIYILAFHVDYWNRLGWKDNFSSAEYSRRQNKYAEWLHSSEVYTPQVVVNGKTEFVGSEEGTLRNAIKNGLQSSPSAQITLSDVKVDKSKATLHYQTEGNIGNSVLLIAVIQKSAQTKVERGENKGRTLSHVQIVRELETLPLKNSGGTATVTLPEGFDPKGGELIALLQNSSTGAITGAAKTIF